MYGNGCAGSTASGVSTGKIRSANSSLHLLLLVVVELVPAQELRCPRSASAGRTSSRKQLAVPLHQLARLAPDRLEHLARHQAAGGPDGDAGGDAALEAGHPDHEELVEVAGEDREEPGPLEQRQVGVLGQLEHPLVERQPGQLAVEEAIVGQVVGLGLVRRLDLEGVAGGGAGRSTSLGPSSRSPAVPARSASLDMRLMVPLDG